MRLEFRRALHGVSLFLLAFGIVQLDLAELFHVLGTGGDRWTLDPALMAIYVCVLAIFMKLQAVTWDTIQAVTGGWYAGQVLASGDGLGGEDVLEIQPGVDVLYQPAPREETYRRLGNYCAWSSLVSFLIPFGHRLLGFCFPGALVGAFPLFLLSGLKLLAVNLILFGVLFRLSALGRVVRRGRSTGESSVMTSLIGAESLPPPRPSRD